MKTNNVITDKQADLIEALLQKCDMKNDAALSRLMRLPPPVISKIRNRKIPVCPSFLIRAHEASDMSIRYLKELAGLPAYVKK